MQALILRRIKGKTIPTIQGYWKGLPFQPINDPLTVVVENEKRIQQAKKALKKK